MPLGLEVNLHRAKILKGKRNLARGLDTTGATMQPGINEKERETDEEKLYQRLVEETQNRGPETSKQPE